MREPAAAEIAIVLDIIAGFDPLDTMTEPVPVQQYRAAAGGDVRGMRLGVLRYGFFDAIDPEVSAAVEAALAVLRGLGAVVDDAVRVPHVDVRVRADDAILQLQLQAGHHRQRHDDCQDADAHAEHGDERDERDERLPALGEQVPQRDVELERYIHAAISYSRFLISGNRMTSRIDRHDLNAELPQHER